MTNLPAYALKKKGIVADGESLTVPMTLMDNRAAVDDVRLDLIDADPAFPGPGGKALTLFKIDRQPSMRASTLQAFRRAQRADTPYLLDQAIQELRDRAGLARTYGGQNSFRAAEFIDAFVDEQKARRPGMCA